MGRGWGGERREGRQHWWVCEKGSDQLIGKTDHEGEGERMEGSVRQQCVLLDVGVGAWGGRVTGLVLSVGPMGRTIGAAGVGRVSHAFALWHGQQACATGVVSPPLRLLSNSWGSTGSHENQGPRAFNEGRAVSYQRWTSHHYNHH